jgi:site-specific recombinase XerD
MNQLAPLPSRNLALVPELIAAAGDRASMRFLEFFAATIRNPHTRRAYSRAVAEFLAWCADSNVPSIAAVQPLHVATWIELQTGRVSAPSVKQRLAAIRHLFDWLVTGQVVPVNPAASVRGPQHIVRHGKTPVLEAVEARALLDSIKVVKTKILPDGTEIDTAEVSLIGLRDRALIALMVFSLARVGAALGMKVEDVYTQNRRLWVRLREKGGKAHAMPWPSQPRRIPARLYRRCGPGERPEGAAVSHHRPWHQPPHGHHDDPGRRSRDDTPSRSSRRHRDLARQS